MSGQSVESVEIVLLIRLSLTGKLLKLEVLETPPSSPTRTPEEVVSPTPSLVYEPPLPVKSPRRPSPALSQIPHSRTPSPEKTAQPEKTSRVQIPQPEELFSLNKTQAKVLNDFNHLVVFGGTATIKQGMKHPELQQLYQTLDAQLSNMKTLQYFDSKFESLMRFIGKDENSPKIFPNLWNEAERDAYADFLFRQMRRQMLSFIRSLYITRGKNFIDNAVANKRKFPDPTDADSWNDAINEKLQAMRKAYPDGSENIFDVDQLEAFFRAYFKFKNPMSLREHPPLEEDPITKFAIAEPIEATKRTGLKQGAHEASFKILEERQKTLMTAKEKKEHKKEIEAANALALLASQRTPPEKSEDVRRSQRIATVEKLRAEKAAKTTAKKTTGRRLPVKKPGTQSL